MDARPTRAFPIWAITAVLSGVWVMAMVDRMIILILVPSIKASLHITDTQISLLHGTAFSVFYALAGLPLGRLVDRAHRRTLIALGLAGWSLATIVCGLATSFGQLFAARIVVGTCQAMLAPATFSMLADCAPPEVRGRTTGVIVSSATVGTALSTMFGGVVLDIFAGLPPIRGPFGVLAPWQSTLVAAGLLGLALSPLLMMVPEPRRITGAEARRFGLLDYVRANRSAMIPLYIGFTMLLMAGYGLSTWYPSLLMRSLGMAPHEAGLTAGVVNLLSAAFAVAAGGFLSDRFVRRDHGVGRLKLVRLLLIAGGFALLTLLDPHSRIVVLVGYLGFVSLAAAASAVAYTVFPEIAPSEGTGQVVALYQFLAYMLGLGLTPTLIALVTDKVLHAETRVNLSMLFVGAPLLFMAAGFVSLAMRPTAKLRASIQREGFAPIVSS